MDKIKVYGLKFFAYHGVFEEEQRNGQHFIVDCEFTIDTSVCDDNLENTVNYGAVSVDIVEFCTKNRFSLLEMLANSLAKHLMLKYPLMESITLTIHKPSAPIPTEFSDVTLTITRKWTTAYLAIGTNLGDKRKNLDFVAAAIENDDNIQLISSSSYIETEPYGVLDQPSFLNGALKIKTLYTPKQLLAFCKDTELNAGRTETRRWGERVLDVDILTFGEEIIFTDSLKIPHPEMHKRSFVLEPLSEIEPYLIHPSLKTDVASLLAKISI